MAEMESSSTSADTASSVHSSLSTRRLDKDVLDVLEDLQLNQKELIQQISNLQENQASILEELKELKRVSAVPKHRSPKVPKVSAGRQLTDTTELLEMILLQLPYKDILRYIRVSKTFRLAILGSIPIQSSLFFVPGTNALASSSVMLNPTMKHEQFYKCIRLWFDDALDRLRYCDRGGRKVLQIKSAEITNAKLQGLPVLSVKMEMISRRWGSPGHFDAGSWKRMYLTRQPCTVQWEFTHCLNMYSHETVSGSVAGLYKMDQFLDALADSIPQHRRR
ncbi:uncharacterized protein K489DRAFT_405527 [Dissoconium aciculare CBS 342.82]|jgi:hypothetical protein|uniref:F-box domain-containing protein n=1 Tax=Dissoconium aciculare CBS 342.82 TaxID=1314786 RepID=A0A6J3LQC4_9PEZI|nr:uncharacterized protein K489DRAFT_405527 [Dissoconium aciculare CBS 342.82]KAF1817838.1 hypothetical protein K489DRAFT_405527 [Dissoconium aciculare CBS 342.82]